MTAASGASHRSSAPRSAPLQRKRERLDRLMVSRGLVASREEALRLILSGAVTINGKTGSKAGELVPHDAVIELLRRSPYVSRGGEKLAHALRAFAISVKGRSCLDVGASTGGFTHCLLLEGASRVYAVDVGKAQLDQRLRGDERVVVMEGRNARYLDPSEFSPRPSLATIDVSFISLEKVLERVSSCLTDDGEIVALVKPQFEVGKAEVGKGVVRDPARHRRVLKRLADFAVECGLIVRGVTPSPLRGPKGNREFFHYLAFGGAPVKNLDEEIDTAVEQSHHGGVNPEKTPAGRVE